MKNIKYPIIALALLAFSCQKSDDGSSADSSDAVTFTASSDIATRADFTESWALGDRLGIFDMNNGYYNYEYTVSSITDGLAELSPAGPLVITYPNSGSMVLTFGYYPYSTRFDGEGFQTVDLSYQEDLLVSDIHTVSNAAGESAEDVNFTFSHALSYLSLTFDFKDEFLKDSGFDSVDEIEAANVEIYIGGFSIGSLEAVGSQDNYDDEYEDGYEYGGDDDDFDTDLEFVMTYAGDPSTHDDLYFEPVDGSESLSFDSFILPLNYTELAEEDPDDQYKEVYEAVVYFRFSTSDGSYVKIYNKKLSEILSEAGGQALAGYKYSYEVSVGRDELTFNPIASSNITGWVDQTATSN